MLGSVCGVSSHGMSRYAVTDVSVRLNLKRSVILNSEMTTERQMQRRMRSKITRICTSNDLDVAHI